MAEAPAACSTFWSLIITTPTQKAMEPGSGFMAAYDGLISSFLLSALAAFAPC
jgi:hypothetical protein